MAYFLSTKAQEDIIAIFLEGVERFGLTQAEKYHDAFEKAFELLSTHPHMAPIREALTPSVRVHPHVSHIILYTVDDQNDVFIIRVRHTHEDWIFDTH